VNLSRVKLSYIKCQLARIMGLVSKGRLDQRDRIPRADLPGNAEVFISKVHEQLNYLTI